MQTAETGVFWTGLSTGLGKTKGRCTQPKGREGARLERGWGLGGRKSQGKGNKTTEHAMAVLGEYPWGNQVVLPAGRTPVTSGNPHKGSGHIGRTGKGV